MSWQEIIKTVKETGPGDMEEYERRMLREEQFGSRKPPTDEETSMINAGEHTFSIINHVQNIIEGIERENEDTMPTEGVKKLLFDILKTIEGK